MTLNEQIARARAKLRELVDQHDTCTRMLDAHPVNHHGMVDRMLELQREIHEFERELAAEVVRAASR